VCSFLNKREEKDEHSIYAKEKSTLIVLNVLISDFITIVSFSLTIALMRRLGSFNSLVHLGGERSPPSLYSNPTAQSLSQRTMAMSPTMSCSTLRTRMWLQKKSIIVLLSSHILLRVTIMLTFCLLVTLSPSKPLSNNCIPERVIVCDLAICTAFRPISRALHSFVCAY
jgi:hypothetical protein